MKLRDDPFLLSGVSHDGSVRVGYYEEPYIWGSGTGECELMEGFPDEGELRVLVTDLSSNGRYATGMYMYPTDDEGTFYRAAFRWRSGEVESMPGAGENVVHYGRSVTDDAVVIVERSEGPRQIQVTWTGGTVRSVHDVVVDAGLHPDLVPLALGVEPDGHYAGRLGISDDGRALYSTILLNAVRPTGGCAKGIRGIFGPGVYAGGTQFNLAWLVSGIDGSVTVDFSSDGEDYEFVGSAAAYDTDK